MRLGPLCLLTAALGCAASTPPIVSGARPRLTQTRHQQRQPRQPLLADLKSHPPVPTMGIVLTAFQIINNVAGAGILTLAAGMAAGVGWYPAILTTLALGAVSGYSFFLIGASCELTAQRTFKGLWAATLGVSSAWVVDLSIALMCFSAAIIYSGILGDVFTPLLALAGLPARLNLRPANIGVITASVLAPLSLLNDLSALAFTSILGCAAVLYTVLFIVVRAVDGSYALPAAGKAAGALLASLPAELAPTFAGQSLWRCDATAFVLVSNLGLAFIAHYNAPAFYDSLTDASPSRFRSVCGLAFAVLTMLYLACMGFGYATFGDAAASNLLRNYAGADRLAVVGRVATGLSILFGYPLVMVGLRDSLCGLLGCLADAVGGSTSGSGSGSARGESSGGLAGALRAAAAPANRKPLILTSLLIVTLIAISVGDIGVVVGISGAVLGAAIVYIIPALIYTRATRAAGGEASPLLEPTMLSLGTVIAVLGVYMTLKS